MPQPALPAPGQQQISALPNWLQRGQGPVTGQVPQRTLMKGSPGFPQPMQPDQQGAFPAKQADLLPGGHADNKPDKAFPKRRLLAGVRHEREHTTSRPIAKEIAKDHLSEHPAYYDVKERKVATAKPRWGKWEMHGLEALGDITHYMRTAARVNSEFEFPDDEKEAAAAEPVSEFAATFFLGCRERGLSLRDTYGAVKRASALDGFIAAELATLPDALFAYCGRMEKRALADGTNIGDYMPAKPAAPAPAPAPAPAAEAPAPAAPVSVTPTPAAAPSGGNGGLAMQAARAAVSPASVGIPAAYKHLVKPWLINEGGDILGGASEKAAPRIGAAATKEVPAIVGAGADEARKQLLNPSSAEAAGTFAANTVGNTGAGVMENVFPGWKGRESGRLGGQMAQFWDSMRSKGLPTAVSEAWGKMSPQQQWGLLAGVGGPLLGLGAAAAGHPMLGLGIGAAGLAGGGYGLYQGAGAPDSGMRGPVQLGRDWLGKADQATQPVRGWWDQIVADNQAKQGPAGSELARAAGQMPPAVPAGG